MAFDEDGGRDIHAEWRRARIAELEKRAAEEAAKRERAYRARLAQPTSNDPRHLRNVSLLRDGLTRKSHHRLSP